MKKSPRVWTMPKGHWPKGKRRSADHGQWSSGLLRLTKLINNHFLPGKISNVRLGMYCGRSARSVARWMTGEKRPSVETQLRVKAWVDARWKEIEKAKLGNAR